MFDWLKFSWTKDHQNNTTTSGTIEDLKKWGPTNLGGKAVTPQNATTQATVFSCIIRNRGANAVPTPDGC
jgi:hypothetical protein